MEVEFYHPDIVTFLDTFPSPTWEHIYKTIALLKFFGYRLGLPQSRSLGRGLFELRTRGVQEVRLVYAFRDRKAVILHAFVKKTQKTPNREIDLARKRMSILTGT